MRRSAPADPQVRARRPSGLVGSAPSVGAPSAAGPVRHGSQAGGGALMFDLWPRGVGPALTRLTCAGVTSACTAKYRESTAGGPPRRPRDQRRSFHGGKLQTWHSSEVRASCAARRLRLSRLCADGVSRAAVPARRPIGCGHGSHVGADTFPEEEGGARSVTRWQQPNTAGVKNATLRNVCRVVLANVLVRHRTERGPIPATSFSPDWRAFRCGLTAHRAVAGAFIAYFDMRK